MSAVDIVIPCYNYARYLSACVYSVLSQHDVSVRVLIIDDCSSDNTAQIGQEIAAADSRVEFRRHKVNKGHIATYNEGLLGWSISKYIVLLSADDLLLPGALSRAVQIMDADENVGMVYGSTIRPEEKIESLHINAHCHTYTRWSGLEWLEGRCRDGYNVISSPEVVVRGAIQRAVGGYRQELPHSGDLEMWLRIAAVSDIVYIRGIPQACYRIHAASMLRSRYGRKLLDLQQRKAAFDFFFQSHHIIISDTPRLQELANRALAREALWEACRAYDRNQVEDTDADELARFAMTTYLAANTLSEYAALLRRRCLGAVICNRTQIFVVTALARRVSQWLRRQRLKRQGI